LWEFDRRDIEGRLGGIVSKVDMECLGLSREDAEDSDQQRLKIRGTG